MEQIKESLSMYVKHRIKPGGFLISVLRNDLFEAISRADFESVKKIDEIVKYIYNNLPSYSYGSRQKVENWLKGVE